MSFGNWKTLMIKCKFTQIYLYIYKKKVISVFISLEYTCVKIYYYHVYKVTFDCMVFNLTTFFSLFYPFFLYFFEFLYKY